MGPHRFPIYGWTMLTGIVVTLIFWARLAKRDERLLFIYIAGLAGAFLGAKIVYILAEGWLYFGKPYMWLMLATGKSIVGALLGGYAAVEVAKYFLQYRRATGDWFAMLVPLGVMIGRVQAACCMAAALAGSASLRGTPCATSWACPAGQRCRWSSGFNALAVVAFFVLRRKQLLTGQHFHLYLIGYGLFPLCA